MGILEDSDMSGHEHETKERIKVEEHDLSEGTFIETRYLGTAADRHDMVVMGRKQVLRVCCPRIRKPYMRLVHSQLTTLPQRNFQTLSMVGFATVLICTWELLFAYV